MNSRDGDSQGLRTSREPGLWQLVQAPRTWLWHAGGRTLGACHGLWLALSVSLEIASPATAASGALTGLVLGPLVSVALPALSARTYLLVMATLPLALDALVWLALDHPGPGPQAAIALGLVLFIWPPLAWCGMRMALRGLLAGHLPFWPRLTLPDTLWHARPVPDPVVRSARERLSLPSPPEEPLPDAPSSDREIDLTLLGLTREEAGDPAGVEAAHGRAVAALKATGNLSSPGDRVRRLRELALARDRVLAALKPHPTGSTTSFRADPVPDVDGLALVASLEQRASESDGRTARLQALRLLAYLEPSRLVPWRRQDPALLLEALEEVGEEACAARFPEDFLCRKLRPDGPLGAWRQTLLMRRRDRTVALAWGMVGSLLALPHALGMVPPDAARFRSGSFASGSWYAEVFTPLWTFLCLVAGWLSGRRGFVSWGMTHLGMGIPEGLRESQGGCGGCLVSLSLYLLGSGLYLLAAWGGYAALVVLHGLGQACWDLGNDLTAGLPVGGWLAHGGVAGGLAWIVLAAERRRRDRHRIRPVRKGRGRLVGRRDRTPQDGV